MRHCVKADCGAKWSGQDEECPWCGTPWAGEGEDQRGPSKCLACDGDMVPRGVVPLRTHGPEEGHFRLFRNWEEHGERLWKLMVYHCQGCGRVEFYDR